VIGVTEFKAKCLALLEEIGEHGGKLTVTKRGKPLATVGPAKQRAWGSPEGVLSHRRLVTSDQRIIDSGLVPVVA
jgi:antitoxin (DNA-binding transcriptional repressor) of toxin-antitoxin stability system